MENRNESRTMNIGNYQVEFNLFDNKLDVIEGIHTNQDLMDCELFIKSGDKFVSLESYLYEKVGEVYGV